MGTESYSSDRVMAELIGMGFEFSDIEEAIKCVGPSMDAAIEFILNGSSGKGEGPSTITVPINKPHDLGKLRQPSMSEYLKCPGKLKRRKVADTSRFRAPFRSEAPCKSELINASSSSDIPVAVSCNEDDWEQSAGDALRRHFGYSSFKAFQKEALAAWFSHKDCLVLAATGSGKSLCFQIPALLTGKVVVVISPLISLMHDQCLKLAKHGVSACFLGSGQIDRTVEQKALSGMYSIIYVCPETVLRLIEPLQRLAEGRGIALFAIDEVHCVSKWGHDFRPDYRRMSVLRESFSAAKLRFLKFDIPLMALTATATMCVRDDIIKSLHMPKDTKIILTSFFRPNLRFSVKHSRMGSLKSYEQDFYELIETYTGKKNLEKNCMKVAPDTMSGTSTGNIFEPDRVHFDDCSDDEDSGLSPDHSSPISEGKKLSVEYLEDACDVFCDTDDLDVSCGGFTEQLPLKHLCEAESPETHYLQSRPEERLKLQLDPLGEGPTIIYVPTRKETLSISKFLGNYGVRAAAYNAKLPKSHLRQVHKEFQDNVVQVVVATIAFGMGIDKLNVRRIIHYGWPQSLEAYYQEAGRAGRDGKLADCVLIANLSRTPSLLPSSRSEEQRKQANKMLSDCFRYGMNTSSCRAKILVEYFGEEFLQEKCLLCDSCINGPPEVQNLKKEATILLQAIVSHYGPGMFGDGLSGDAVIGSHVRQSRIVEKPNFKILISEIRQQHPEFTSSDLLWWRGLVRILEAKKYIREGDDKTHVQIKSPEATESGVDFIRSENPMFEIHPEADMVLSMSKSKSYSSFSEWGKGWADPEIRRQRLGRKGSRRKSKRTRQAGSNTVRGRLATKLSKKK